MGHTLSNDDALLVVCEVGRVRLDVEVGGNIHAVASVQSHVNELDFPSMWVLLLINIEEVDWSLLFLQLLNHANVDVFAENRGNNLVIFLSLHHANVLFVDELLWSPVEVRPDGDHLLFVSEDLAQHIGSNEAFLVPLFIVISQ